MKKFLFIIPKVKLFKYIMMVFLACCTTLSKADIHRTGCWIPGTNKIWHTNDPAHPGSTNFLNDGVGTAALNGIDDGYNDKDGRCNNGGSITCVVYWQVSSYHPSGEQRGVGELSEYSIEFCPIDDYIPALFIFTGVIFFFRTRNLHRLNESKPNHSSL